jgi:small-conductance mechanosensitive channel
MDWNTLVTTTYRNILEIFPAVMASIVIFILFWISGILTQFLITRLANKRGLNPELLKLNGRTVKIGLIIFDLVTALGTIGINVSALVAGLGLTGFALKDVVSNLIAGSMILLHRPFKVHDIIGVAGHEGKVINIDLRYKTIEADGKKVLIPNSTLFTKEISILN